MLRVSSTTPTCGAHVPQYAEQVTRPLGHVSLPPPAAGAERVSRPPQPVGEPGPRRHGYGYDGSGVPLCWAPGLAAPWVLRVNGDNLADQVKEASLLDALNVNWRGCCGR